VGPADDKIVAIIVKRSCDREIRLRTGKSTSAENHYTIFQEYLMKASSMLKEDSPIKMGKIEAACKIKF
jgi:hypothetical protein